MHIRITKDDRRLHSDARVTQDGVHLFAGHLPGGRMCHHNRLAVGKLRLEYGGHLGQHSASYLQRMSLCGIL